MSPDNNWKRINRCGEIIKNACVDCAVGGKCNSGEICFDVNGPQQRNPTEISRLNFGDLAWFPEAILCADCQRRRNRLQENNGEPQYWLTAVDARRQLQRRSEKSGLQLPDSSEMPKSRFLSRLQKAYSK